MKPLLLTTCLPLAAAVLGAVALPASAQDRIYRCGNEYTNQIKGRSDCKLVEGGNVTVVRGTIGSVMQGDCDRIPAGVPLRQAFALMAGDRDGVAVVHCSGVTEVSALQSASAQGALAGGFHPMQTFGDPAVAARSLPGCTITIEAPQPLDTMLVALAERTGISRTRLSRTRLPVSASSW